MSRMAHTVPGLLGPGQGVTAPGKRKASSRHRKKPASKVSSLVREGNWAVPVQPMYKDVKE